MAQLAIQRVVGTGLAAAYAAVNNGDTIPTEGDKTFLHVKNANGGSVTVAIDSVQPCSHGFDHDLSVAIPNGQERMIGPLSKERFGALATVTYSATAGVTSAAISE